MSVIKRLLTQHDKQRKKQLQDEMEVIEAEEDTLSLQDEAPASEEESESEPDNYKEIFGMYTYMK